MNRFETSKLKGQKLNLSTLLSKPEFKQQYLTPIRSLDEEDHCTLLTKVIENECSLAELKVASAQQKQLRALRTAFIRLTNCEPWEAAKELYPQFATDEQLHKYIHVDLKKTVPVIHRFLPESKKLNSIEYNRRQLPCDYSWYCFCCNR